MSGTLDLYWNTTSDLLMRQEIDSSTGYSYQYRNIGQTSNKGVELALNYHLIRTKDFNLNVSATYNFNKNNIDELDGGKIFTIIVDGGLQHNILHMTMFCQRANL